MDRLHAIDLFCGAGGLSVGLSTAGFHIVLANEIETDFANTFAANHPETEVLCDDIHEIDFQQKLKSLNIKPGEVFLVCGGPPCQGFSTVGSKNKRDPRNSLFYEFIRSISETSPQYVLFENVAGFRQLYKGEAYFTLIKELNNLGYDCASRIVDASDYGLPQQRKRTIVIGWKKGLTPVSFPFPTHGEECDLFDTTRKLTIMDAISDLPPLKPGESASEYLSPPKNQYQQKLRNGAKTLTEHNCSNYGGKMRKILELIPPGGCVHDLPIELRPKSYFSNTYARILPDRPAPTITRNFGTPSSSRCIHPFQNRALSTREGARLQSFPDDYVFIGSKTSKNLQIGNAVPPLLGEILGKQIIEAIRSNDTNSATSESKRTRRNA